MTILICDICGTSYPETDDKCPTCGYSRALLTETPYSSHTHAPQKKVRGGRYSKKNVSIRLQELEAEKHHDAQELKKKDEAASDTALAEDMEAALAAAETVLADIPTEQKAPAADGAGEVPEESPEEKAQREKQEKEKALLKAYRRDVSLNLLLFASVAAFLLSLSYLMINYGIPFIRSFI